MYVSYLFESYTTDDAIIKIDVHMKQFTQQSNRSPLEYAKVLWDKAPRGDGVCKDYVSKATFWLEIRRNRSTTVWLHTGAQTWAVLYMTWIAMQNLILNNNIVRVTLMSPVTWTRRIADARILREAGIKLITLVWPLPRQWNCVARMHCHPYFNPHRWQFWYWTYENESFNRFHRHRQRR